MNAAVNDLTKHYDVCMALVGERLRKSISGDDCWLLEGLSNEKSCKGNCQCE